MSVAILIVNWNGGAGLASCLESALSACHEPPVAKHVVVFDNASADGSIELAKATAPDAQFIRNLTNVGFASAVNLAARYAPAASDLLLLNPDARLAPGALERLLAELNDDSNVGVVGPRILAPDGAVQLTCARSDLSLEALFYELSGLRRLWPQRFRFGMYRLERWDHQGDRDVQCLSGACLLIRRAVFDELGGLDETIPMYFEDMDFCARARERGWRVRFIGDAIARHEGARSASCHPRRADLHVMEEGDARWLFFRRHRSRRDAALASIMIGLGSAMRGMIAASVSEAMRLLGREQSFRRMKALRQKYGALAWWSVASRKPLIRSVDHHSPTA